MGTAALDRDVTKGKRGKESSEDGGYGVIVLLFKRITCVVPKDANSWGVRSTSEIPTYHSDVAIIDWKVV